ncbi:hypothetical protein ABIA39_005211, partial [Nocardia sp. GAS34]|uniref:hypothetical protein n=1 Tax=unclassified Nocardia TaxID=2637762 RepID=UPI003D250268
GPSSYVRQGLSSLVRERARTHHRAVSSWESSIKVITLSEKKKDSSPIADRHRLRADCWRIGPDPIREHPRTAWVAAFPQVN